MDLLIPLVLVGAYIWAVAIVITAFMEKEDDDH